MVQMENGRLNTCADEMDRIFDSLNHAEGALAGVALLISYIEGELTNPSLLDGCFKAMQELSDNFAKVQGVLGVAERGVARQGASLIVNGGSLEMLQRQCPSGVGIEIFTAQLIENALEQRAETIKTSKVG